LTCLLPDFWAFLGRPGLVGTRHCCFWAFSDTCRSNVLACPQAPAKARPPAHHWCCAPHGVHGRPCRPRVTNGMSIDQSPCAPLTAAARLRALPANPNAPSPCQAFMRRRLRAKTNHGRLISSPMSLPPVWTVQSHSPGLRCQHTDPLPFPLATMRVAFFRSAEDWEGSRGC
jgi:hypothetical protein